jgi:hypothetical protein
VQLIIGAGRVERYVDRADELLVSYRSDDALRYLDFQLRELLSLLPSLRVILLLGAKAARGWERAAIEGDYAVLRAPHPSPRGTASRPGARDEIRDALIKARQLGGYP